jgi:hypothetical protein
LKDGYRHGKKIIAEKADQDEIIKHLFKIYKVKKYIAV